MSFLIQYSCKHCGFKSPDDSKSLIDPMGMPECYICACPSCQKLFHRPYENGKPVEKCAYCGSKDIVIYTGLKIPCPVCGSKNMDLECIGTCF